MTCLYASELWRRQLQTLLFSASDNCSSSDKSFEWKSRATELGAILWAEEDLMESVNAPAPALSKSSKTFRKGLSNK